MDTITQDASRASIEASGANNGDVSGTSVAKVDAIVVVGAEPKSDGLDGMATLVTEDIYDNLKVFIK